MNVKTEFGKIAITVGDGYHEIYIDGKFTQPWLKDGQTGEYAADPGPHRVGVRKGGVWEYDETVIVPGEDEAAPEEPKPEQPAEERKNTVSIDVNNIKAMLQDLRNMVVFMEAALNQEDE